ncbi:hypothetical protein CMK17_17740, partial [Candidatus Poribacteria bacterium]|nr:hypothetical protein [Candidatus Poribacteria bacterium]
MPRNSLGFLLVTIERFFIYPYLIAKITAIFMLLFWLSLIGFIGCNQDDEEMRTTQLEEITWKDGSKMLRIPAGTFEMGDQFNDGPIYEKPVH